MIVICISSIVYFLLNQYDSSFIPMKIDPRKMKSNIKDAYNDFHNMRNFLLGNEYKHDVYESFLLFQSSSLQLLS